MKLNETSAWDAGQIEDGLIRDVKVLGRTSKNGRVYPKTTTEKAIAKMEGAKVNLDHHSHRGKLTPVPLTSRFGKLVNVRETEDGPRADLRYLTSHPMAAAIVEAATNMPEMLGFSISAEGKVAKEKDADGNEVIESIEQIFSVDLVADPATTSSLFESEDYSDDEEEGDEPQSPEDAHKDGVKDAICAIIDAGGDMGDMLKQIKDLLKAHDKVFGSDDEEEASDDGEGEKEEEESHTPQISVLCEAAGVQDHAQLLDWIQQKKIVKKVRSAVPTPMTEATDFNKLLRTY